MTSSVPDWLASRLRRAAFFSVLGWSGACLAVLALLAGIGSLFYFKEVKEIFPPLFWIGVFTVVLVWFLKELWQALSVVLHPDRSSEVNYLRRFGSLAVTVEAIMAEARDCGMASVGKGLIFTRTWLIVSETGAFSLRRLEDVDWAYIKEAPINIFSPLPILPRKKVLVLKTQGAPDVEMRGSSDQTSDWLNQVLERCPEVVMGGGEEK